jgi:hypothetical protein
MAATVRATAQAFLTSGTTSSITVPAAVQAGDLLVLHVAGYFTPALPAGWTKYYTRAGSNVGCFVAAKTAGSGDAGTSVSITWSGNGQAVMTMIAVAGSLGVRAVANLWASSGGNASPGAINALDGDMVLYLGANRSGGGVPVVSRGSVDVSGSGSTNMGGVIAHEVLAADAPGLQASFTSLSGGATQGYAYSTLVIAGVTPPATVAGISLRDKAQAFVNGTSTTITIPATIQVGDYLVLQAVGAWAPTMPGGWNSLYANSGSNVGSFVASKTAVAGDAGSTVTVAWSGNQSGVLNLIALVTPGYGLRRISNDWSSAGATDLPSDLSSVNNGDWVIALGANRAASNIPTVPGTTVDVSGSGGTTAFSGIIAHEALGYDIVGASYQFNAPGAGSGYEYTLLVVAATPVVASRILSRQSAEVLASASATNRLLSHQSTEVLASASSANRLLSRQSVEVLTPSLPRFRGWGTRY